MITNMAEMARRLKSKLQRRCLRTLMICAAFFVLASGGCASFQRRLIYLTGHLPDNIAGLALLAPYNCLADVGQAHIHILPVRWLLFDRFPAETYLRTYRGPLAVLVGGQDTIVPKRFGYRLYNSYSGPKRLWEFPRATHDSLMFQPPEVWKQIVAFWQRRKEAGE